MTEEEKDVKPVEEEPTPAPSPEETSDEPEDKAPGEPLEAPVEPEKETEEVEETVEPEAEPEDEDKKAEEIENLKKALRQEREKNRKVSQPTTTPTRPSATPSMDTDPLSKKLVEANEKEALSVLYGEYPDLAPENDLDNSLFNKFTRGYKVLVDIDGDLPVTKEAILAKGREVMSHIRPSSTPASKKVEKQAEAANLGKPSSGKPRPTKTVTDSDRKAAAYAGQSIDEYMKHKDVFKDDEIPI